MSNDNENVVCFTGVTKLDIPADRVLGAAAENNLKDCIVIGRLEDGVEYFASSLGNPAEVLYLIKRLEKLLLEDDVGRSAG